ncbi:MAG: tetratricopeptide repeat protein [Planctomycetota bacterium]|jgi:tetratricopeptide (TPR) repeat protein|nr:tetratricopeptide repeat protein [Planctomycetota bacterium]
MRNFLRLLLLALALTVPLFGGETRNVETRAVPPPPRKMLYASAKALERAGEFAEAKAIYRMALHNGAGGRNKDEAFLGLARCEEQEGNFWAAFLAVESSYPTRDELLNLPAAERGDELARRAKMEMRYGDELSKLGDAETPATQDGKKLNGYQAAAAIFYAVVYNNPQAPVARTALLRRGDCLKNAGDFAEAEKSYRMLINTFPDAPEVAAAKISLASALAEKTADNGGLRGREERETTDLLLSTSTAPLPPELREKLAATQSEIDENKAQTLLATVKNYYAKRLNSRDRHAATFLLNDILDRYPQTAAAAEAAKMLGKSAAGSGQ